MMVSGYRLTKSRILRESNDFDVVFNNPDYRLSVGYFLILAKESQLSFSRLGMVISKKNVPKSVHRNRTKRLIRESFRKQLLVKNLDIVILARKGITAKENDVLTASLDKGWQNLDQSEQAKVKQRQGK